MVKYLSFLLLSSIVFLLHSPGRVDLNAGSGIEKSESDHDAPGVADEWLFQQKAFPYGRLDIQAQRQAVASVLEIQKKYRALRTESGDDWQFVGPVTIGGRVIDIECPAGNDNTVFVGSASGGILRSYDGGAHWKNIFDGYETLSIGDLAIDPDDTSILYVGTGEPNCGIGSVTYDGHGIYKSTDGGNSWTNVGLENCGSTGRIAVDPQNPDIIYAAMMGDLFQDSPDRGLYRSTDAGATWQQVLFVTDSTGAFDVAINPQDPNIVYATTWERVRRYYRRDYTGYTSRIYRSTDGGTTWSQLGGGLPGDQLCKITLALAPSDPSIIYAGIIGSDEQLMDIYKTSNGGDTWNPLNCTAQLNLSQDFWYGGVRVDPNDANKVFWIGFTSSRSTDGGNTWNDFANAAHVDCHALFISPTDPGYKILGSDGGLFFTHNNFSTYTLNQNIPVTQIYTLDVYPSDTSYLIAGAQDNGSFRKTGAAWNYAFGGDGTSTRIMPVDENSYFADYQYGGYYGVLSSGAVSLSGLNYSDRYNWRSPVEVNPRNPATVYFGGAHVQRSQNYGNTLQTISEDLTNGPQGYGLVYGSIFIIHNAPADTNYIYVGTDDGNVWVSKDYGLHWDQINAGLPYRSITGIDTDPKDANTVYVTLSGFRWADNAAHVYRSADAGLSWEAISGGLPDVPCNAIAVDTAADDPTNNLYVATDVGVYYSFDDGVTWSLLGSALPVCSVYELNLNSETATLFAGTYGRGIYKIRLPQEPVLTVSGIMEPRILVYPNPAADYVIISAGDRTVRTLRIFDIQGNLQYMKKTDEDTERIDLSALAAGTYFIQISEGSRNFVRKLMHE